LDATSTAAVVGQLGTAAAAIVTKIPIVAGIAIGVGLLGFGIQYLVNTFKKTAH
jgi:hypothetical protein